MDGLTAAWREMESDRDLLREMGRNARRKIETDYEAMSHLDRLTDIYRSIAA